MSLLIRRHYKKLSLTRQKIKIRSIKLIEEIDNKLIEEMKIRIIDLDMWFLREKIKKHQKIIGANELVKREVLLEETKMRRMLLEIKELQNKKISLMQKGIYFFDCCFVIF